MTSIISIYRRFPTKESCLEHLEKVRWKDEPCCPYCMSEKVSRKKEIEQRDRWQFHHVSKKYLPLYLNELTFSYAGFYGSENTIKREEIIE